MKQLAVVGVVRGWLLVSTLQASLGQLPPSQECVRCKCGDCSKSCCKVFSPSGLTDLRVAVNCSQPDDAIILATDAMSTDPDPGSQCHGHSLTHTNGCLTRAPTNLCTFTQIKAVSLRNNSLSKIPDLTCLPGLIYLDLRKNVITTVAQSTFKGLIALREVYMDDNAITYIHPLAFGTSASVLNVFSVSGNLLTVVDPWLFLLPHPFCQFNFSHNRIARLTNEQHFVIGQSSGEHYGPGFVDVTYNRMVVSPAEDMKQYGINDVPDLLPFVSWGFDLRFNPFHCDCKFFKTVKFLDYVSTYLWRSYFNITCASPSHFRGLPLIQLPLDQLTCPVTVTCPVTCTCTQRPYYGDVLVNCTHKRLTTLPRDLPEGNLTLDMTGNAIRRLDLRDYLQRVVHLNLTANHLYEVDQQAALALRHVRSLDLRENDLHHVPTTLQVVSPDTLYLDIGTLKCTCQLEWFPRWAGRHVYENLQKVTCLSGSDGRQVLLVNATRRDLGCEAEDPLHSHEAWAYVIVAAALVIIVPILVVVFRHEVLVLHHRFFYRQSAEKHFPTLLDVPGYDVFISTATNSDNDATWVNRILLPAMERRRLTYCLPQGDDSPEALHKLRQSKCALILLSPDYLAQPTCCFQFRQAYNTMVKEGHGRVFIVYVRKVTRSQVQDHLLRAMLNLNMAYSGNNPDDLHNLINLI